MIRSRAAHRSFFLLVVYCWYRSRWRRRFFFWLWCQCIAYKIRHKSSTHAQSRRCISSTFFSIPKIYLPLGQFRFFEQFYFFRCFRWHFSIVMHKRAQVHMQIWAVICLSWVFSSWTFMLRTPCTMFGFYVCHRMCCQTGEKAKQSKIIKIKPVQTEGLVFQTIFLLGARSYMYIFGIHETQCIVCRCCPLCVLLFSLPLFIYILSVLRIECEILRRTQTENTELNLKWNGNDITAADDFDDNAINMQNIVMLKTTLLCSVRVCTPSMMTMSTTNELTRVLKTVQEEEEEEGKDAPNL